MSEADITLFEDEISRQNDLVTLSSTDAELIFELNQENENEQLIEDYENEFFGERHASVQEMENPCPQLPFKEFKTQLTRVTDNVYKKIIEPGSGNNVDFERLKVTYAYAMFTEFYDDPFDSSILNKQQGIVNIKKGIEPLMGITEALLTMKNQEESIFWISSDAMFGKLGCVPRVKPNADILLRAKVTSVEKARIADTTNDETDDKTPFHKFYKEAHKKYLAAYNSFTFGNYHEAISTYRNWIHKLENAHTSNDEDEMKQKEMLIKMYQNICICYNKINKPEKTCIMMRELEKLTSIEDNPKALFAKGRAKLMFNDFEYARKYFLMAKKLVPGDPKLAAAIDELNQREEEQAVYKAQSQERVRLFKEEVVEAEKKNRIEAEKKRREDEALQSQIDKLQGELQKFIQDFKNDGDVTRISLNSDDWTHFHLKLAKKVCQQNNVRMKGTQSIKKDKIYYYLSK